MQADNNTTNVPTWEEVESMVLEPYDLNKPAIRYAVNEWKKETEQVRESGDDIGEVICRFNTKDSIQAIVEYFRARIDLFEIIYNHNIAAQIRDQKLSNVLIALSSSQGIFVNSEQGHRLVPECLGVYKIDEKQFHKKIVEASKVRALNETSEESQEPEWPKNPAFDVSSFVNDLESFIEENDKAACESILRVCDDRDFAEMIAGDEKMPQPLKFLAGLVLKTKPALQIELQQQKVGF